MTIPRHHHAQEKRTNLARLLDGLRRPAAVAACSLLLIVAARSDDPAAPSTSGDAASITEAAITDDDRQHWAYQPLSRADVPAVVDRDWPVNEIDHFILAALERDGLAPLPPADRRTLLRRLSFDLTGLPPTADDVEAFAADTSPDAYARRVERLLASPAYGERWGQHWLDLARFAETDGFEQDRFRPDAWKYRDWVIDALNRDMPYDEFVFQQIAGDELSGGDTAAAIATGFCLCGPDMPDINLIEERRHVVLNEITSTVGSALLGLQFECAQCHDHKYDAISQMDFYRLRAFFDSGVHFDKRSADRRLRESGPDPIASYVMIRGDFRRRGPQVRPAFPRIVNRRHVTIPQPSAGATSTGYRTALAKWLTQPDHPLVTRVIVNRLWQHHFGQGLVRSPSDFGVMGEWPTHAELLDWLATELPRRGWSLKAVHRLIVTSATYRQSSRATTPTWSAARQAEAASRLARSFKADPDNHLLGRRPRRRLDGEAIRDSMLAAAGQLVRRRGGAGVRPPLPQTVLSTLRRTADWEVSPDPADHYRRSIYLFVRRNLRYPFFEVFDRPDTNASCPQRNRTTIAPQALSLLNSDLSLTAARHLAGRGLEAVSSGPADAARYVIQFALSRPATRSEFDEASQFLRQQAEAITASKREDSLLALPAPFPSGCDPAMGAALVDFSLAVLNSNEFLYID